MYKYDAIDRQLINERVDQFRDQVRRWKAGELTDDEFRPLRLQNGLYIQRHAPMFRIAVPYGMMNAAQLRKLAIVARTYDKGYGHFTTRHNLQLNWPKIEDVPDILAELAEVEMHAIQTSGNCIRNVTTDQFAGVAADEVIDPRPLAEILRQWSTFHPEFAFLPRKFKIAISGTREDRAVTWFHDIGLHLKQQDGEVGFTRHRRRRPRAHPDPRPGGARIPALAAHPHLREAILRVYNRFGRRDNAYKARIKILVQALGIEEFAKQVEAEWAQLKDGPATITQGELDRVAAHFGAPAYDDLPAIDLGFEQHRHEKGLRPLGRPQHPRPQGAGYAAVTLSLKPHGVAPGDITSEQMELPSPTSPTVTASANCASATSRTSSWPTSGNPTSTRSGSRPGRTAWRRPTSAC
jgi:sulfite reductase (NADPH) hemoprotein beta-component